MKHPNPFLLLAAFFAAGCNPATNFESVPSVASLPSQTLELQPVPIRSFIGYPSQLLIADTLLLINDAVDNKTLLIYDLKHDKELNRCIHIGNGPAEVLLPIDMSIVGDELAVLQRNKKSFLHYRLKSLLHADTIPQLRTVDMEHIADRACVTPAGYILSGIFGAKDLAYACDRQGKLSHPVHLFPDYMEEIEDPSLRYRLGQGYICSRDERLFFASLFSGEINTYRMTTDSLVLLRSLRFRTADPIKRQVADQDYAIHTQTVVHAQGVYATARNFYVLYSGASMIDSNKATHNYILRFDHRGMLISSYKIVPRAFCFAISDNDRYAYVATLSEDFEYIISKAEL